MPYGGYIPFGRWTEEGPLPEDYTGMVETESARPSARTKRNVRESDATLIITRGGCEGGTLLTSDTARKGGKSLLVIDLAEVDANRAIAAVSEWFSKIAPEKINIAGPRASKDSAIYAEALKILLAVFSGLEQPA